MALQYSSGSLLDKLNVKIKRLADSILCDVIILQACFYSARKLTFEITDSTYGLSGCDLLCFSSSVTISSALEKDLHLRSLLRRAPPPPPDPRPLANSQVTHAHKFILCVIIWTKLCTKSHL